MNQEREILSENKKNQARKKSITKARHPEISTLQMRNPCSLTLLALQVKYKKYNNSIILIVHLCPTRT